MMSAVENYFCGVFKCWRNKLSNRELAIVSWLIILGMLFLVTRSSRKLLLGSLNTLADLLFQPAFRLILCYQIIILSVLSWIIIQNCLSWWILKDYLLVFLTSIVTFLGTSRLTNFWNALSSSFGFGEFFKFILGNYTFSYWIEMLLVFFFTVFVFVTVAIQYSGKHEYRELNKVSNNLTMLIGFLLIILFSWQLIAKWQLELHLVYWINFFIAPVTWTVNLPLIILTIPLFEYDNIDQLCVFKVTSRNLIEQVLVFLVMRIKFNRLRFQKLENNIIETHQGGVLNRRMIIILCDETSADKAKKIEMYYKLMFAGGSVYKKNKKVIPIRVECRKESNRELLIPPYECSQLKEEYKMKNF